MDRSDCTPTPDEAFDATLYTWVDWKGTFDSEADARAAWDRMIAEVERSAAEKALTEFAAEEDREADRILSDMPDAFSGLSNERSRRLGEAHELRKSAARASARAEVYRREGKE